VSIDDLTLPATLTGQRNTGTAQATDGRDLTLLILSGPITAGPLILFSYATRRVRMATVGLVQYLNPTLQFGCAVLVFAEPFTAWHAIAFPMIWVALALYSASTLAGGHASRKAARKAATSATTDT
jgi:chloramphenicol-sensitive protein RarD